jgi:preprotein translocase subunit SecY
MPGRKNDYEQFKNTSPVTKKKRSVNLKFLNRLPGKKIARGIGEFLSNKDVVSKILVTILVIVIYRILSSIPLPGVDMNIYREVFSSRTASEANYIFTIFTGGRLETPSIIGLGIAAYINASIIMQLLPYAITRLKEIQKDGERGKQIINQITRFISVPLAFMYSIVYLVVLSRNDLGTAGIGLPTGTYLIPHAADADFPSGLRILFMALVLTGGTMLLMWLSEIITEKGLGNGSSIIISVGILASLPALISQDYSQLNIPNLVNNLVQGNFSALTDPLTLALIIVAIGFVFVIAAIIFISESQRKIDIQYARRVREGEGGQGSFLPIKFTVTGVMPVIFAFALLSIPQLIVPIVESSGNASPFMLDVVNSVKAGPLYATADQIIDGKDLQYELLYFALVIIFGVFYSYIVLNPKETAENLQKSGAFVPGIRPGKSTENYIAGVLFRISFFGALFLGIIALIPVLGRNLVYSSSSVYLAVLSGIGGTSLLIIVSVILDTLRQYKSIVATRSYERYLK